MATSNDTPNNPAPSPFFSLSVEYTIPKDATTDALCDDLEILLSNGVSVIEATHESLDDIQWAGLFSLRKALAIWREIDSRRAAEKCASLAQSKTARNPGSDNDTPDAGNDRRH